MKVKDIIADTEWYPSRRYGVDRPRVSVLLPTFCRGQSGLFLRSARSVLEQSLAELELIIVDDASTDGTAGQIAELMARDERVSLLRHPRNVGLPAVSEYEAFRKARAEYLAFAFDDDEFCPGALAELLAAATAGGRAMVHGYVKLFVRDAATRREVGVVLGRAATARCSSAASTTCPTTPCCCTAAWSKPSASTTRTSPWPGSATGTCGGGWPRGTRSRRRRSWRAGSTARPPTTASAIRGWSISGRAASGWTCPATPASAGRHRGVRRAGRARRTLARGGDCRAGNRREFPRKVLVRQAFLWCGRLGCQGRRDARTTSCRRPAVGRDALPQCLGGAVLRPSAGPAAPPRADRLPRNAPRGRDDRGHGDRVRPRRAGDATLD